LGFYIGGCWAFFALFNIKAHTLIFTQRLEAFVFDCAKMNENITAFIFFDKAEPFLLIEPFYCSFCPSYTYFPYLYYF